MCLYEPPCLVSRSFGGGGGDKGAGPPPAGHTHNSRGCWGPRSNLTLTETPGVLNTLEQASAQEVPSARTKVASCIP